MGAAMPNRAALLHSVMNAMTALNRAAAALEPRQVEVYDEDTEDPRWLAPRVSIVQHSAGSDSGEGLGFAPVPAAPDPLDEITGIQGLPPGSW